MQHTTIGLDIAKNVFHVVDIDRHNKIVIRKKLARRKMLAYFANLAAGVVAMEACATAHYWGRELRKLGHTVRLIPTRAVTPYVQGNKNDYNDALAIAEASSRPGLRCGASRQLRSKIARPYTALGRGVCGSGRE